MKQWNACQQQPGTLSAPFFPGCLLHPPPQSIKAQTPALLRSNPGVKTSGFLKVSCFPPRVAILSGWDVQHKCLPRDANEWIWEFRHSSAGNWLLICDGSMVDPRGFWGAKKTHSPWPSLWVPCGWNFLMANQPYSCISCGLFRTGIKEPKLL